MLLNLSLALLLLGCTTTQHNQVAEPEAFTPRFDARAPFYDTGFGIGTKKIPMKPKSHRNSQ